MQLTLSKFLQILIFSLVLTTLLTNVQAKYTVYDPNIFHSALGNNKFTMINNFEALVMSNEQLDTGKVFKNKFQLQQVLKHGQGLVETIKEAYQLIKENSDKIYFTEEGNLELTLQFENGGEQQEWTLKFPLNEEQGSQIQALIAISEALQFEMKSQTWQLNQLEQARENYIKAKIEAAQSQEVKQKVEQVPEQKIIQAENTILGNMKEKLDELKGRSFEIMDAFALKVKSYQEYQETLKKKVSGMELDQKFEGAIQSYKQKYAQLTSGFQNLKQITALHGLRAWKQVETLAQEGTKRLKGLKSWFETL